MSDKLWQIIEPLLPPEPSKDKGGRPRVPARAVLCGLIYVLKTGIPWRRLPKQLGYGSGVTCWRRLREWQKAGVFILLFRNLLDRLGRCGTIDWSQACVDSATVPAKKGQNVEPNPTDRGKSGSKGHLLTTPAAPSGSRCALVFAPRAHSRSCPGSGRRTPTLWTRGA